MAMGPCLLSAAGAFRPSSCARLAEARKAGCDLAVICTQPGSGSQRNAERQGFQVVYARTMMVKE